MSLACAIGILLGTGLELSNSTDPALLSSNDTRQKLTRLIDYIEYEYVDDVDMDSIVDVTVNEILSDLDPHSVYIPEEEYASLTASMQGNFVGIGVSFYNVNDTIAVIRTLEGGPSERVGIEGGDRILYANGMPLFNRKISNDSITEHLKGEENTEVELKVLREGEPELLTFNVTRGKVPLKSVESSYMLTDRLGYIKINRFAESTYEEFRRSLADLKRQGAEEIALDLRNNPGGYLGEATQIVDEFLPEDKLMLITKNKSNSIEKTYATDKGIFEHGKLYIMINENSASASEIVAGALQDNDKGTIVGRRSFGKGLVQREMGLGDGSAVRLTIARYYTPTGRSIQRPYDEGNKAYFNDYLNRYRNGELISADSISVEDSLKYVTPGGKVVYGGGGIIPDVFVPKDTAFEKESLNLMLHSGFLDRFIFEILEENRHYYNGLSYEDFLEREIIDQEVLEAFQRFTARENFRIKISEYLPVLRRFLKATMAQQLFGSNEFQQILNTEDPVIENILELSSRNANFKKIGDTPVSLNGNFIVDLGMHTLVPLRKNVCGHRSATTTSNRKLAAMPGKRSGYI